MNKLVLVCSLSLIAACGNDTNGPSAAKACADLATARCQKRQSCSNGANITSAYGDMNTCIQREQISCMAGLSATGTGNSPSAVESCVAAYPSFACADFFANNPPAACIATGTLADGAACTFAGQCKSTYCNNNKTSNCGTCGAAAATGSSCVMTGCARGQICPARSQVCLVPAAAGAACNNDTQPCAADLACVGGGANATCMTGLMSGAPCGANIGQCDGTMGLTCTGAAGSKTCQPTVYAGDMQPCGSMTNAFIGCAAGGECYTATGVALAGQMGMCKTAVADGKACDITLGPPCLAPARCIVSGAGTAGVCTLPSGSC
jgi:hypothetical protein